jgi:predicted transcriptional regulator of viral defense system
MDSLKDRAMALLRERGMARLKDFTELNIPASILRRLVADDLVESPARGIYRLAGIEMDFSSENTAVALFRTDGVLCLASAADFHQLVNDFDGAEIYVAVPPTLRDRDPVSGIHLVRWVPDNLSRDFGVGEADLCGIKVKVTTPERTVVDLLRYQRRLPDGVRYASEALYSLVERDECRFDELMRLAARFKVDEEVASVVRAVSRSSRM